MSALNRDDLAGALFNAWIRPYDGPRLTWGEVLLRWSSWADAWRGLADHARAIVSRRRELGGRHLEGLAAALFVEWKRLDPSAYRADLVWTALSEATCARWRNVAREVIALAPRISPRTVNAEVSP
jgi:hypothetical protein